MVTYTHWKGLKGEIDRVAETHDTVRPARIYHVIWEIGKTELSTMHNVVKLISLEKTSQGRMKHVTLKLFRALKSAQAEATQRATEHRGLTSQEPLPRRALKKQEYNNLRASIDRQSRNEWMHKYGVDPYLHGNNTISDGVRAIGGRKEQHRLEDGTLSEAADW